MQEALRLFSTLEPSTAEWILSAGVEYSIGCDQAILMEGQQSGALFIVLDGLFAVRMSALQTGPLVLLGPGELVGEISFLENLPATASVVACEESRVLCVARDVLEQRISDEPRFAADFYRALAQTLSRRLRERSLALAAVDGGRLANRPTQTPAWSMLIGTLSAFKELLHRADVAAKHGDFEIPVGLLAEISSKFQDLYLHLTQLTREVINSEALVEMESALRREFAPYLHLTSTSRRVLTKPRGYAGDFLTIDCMYRIETGGVPPLGPLIDRLFLERPVSRAVRNRRGLLADEIAISLRHGGGSARVTSLACGPAAELFDVFIANPGAKLQATLIDIDFQALAFVADRRDAAGLAKRMRLEHANLVYLATGRTVIELSGQNLIYSIGLIDYFEDRFVIALLNWIHGCLAPGGKAILGNFHKRNPDRAMMDLILDWKLIHRSEQDMNRLFEASRFARPCTEIRYEQEGINMFACGIKE